VFITIPRNPRVLKTTGCFSLRSFQAAMAATRFDSCQMAKMTWSWVIGGPETRQVRATSAT
jgi:hypothetical protein